MRPHTLLTGTAIALGAALTMSSPAQAQAVCELTIGANTNQTGGSTAAEAGDIACGEGAVAGNPAPIPPGTAPATAVAIGNKAKATGQDGVAVGDQALSSGFHSTAIGGEAVASAPGSQAFGWQAGATGTQTTAVGNQTKAIGNNSTALGNGAIATGDNSLALGRGALAGAANSVAIGQGANTGAFTNSVALGTGTTATANNQVNVGNRTIGGVAAGVLATDAVNKGQLDAAVGGITADIGGLLLSDRRQDRNIGKANEGVAMALALDSPNVPAGAHFAISGGIGGYQGKHSLATAISAAVGEMSTVSAGFGYGLNSGEVGYRAGFQIAF